MIVNLAPEERHYFDTYTTLHFARKTKKVVNHIKINEFVGEYFCATLEFLVLLVLKLSSFRVKCI